MSCQSWEHLAPEDDCPACGGGRGQMRTVRKENVWWLQCSTDPDHTRQLEDWEVEHWLLKEEG